METIEGGVKIVKVDQTAPLLRSIRQRIKPVQPTVVKHTSKHRTSRPTHGVLKHGVTARTTPRFKGVRDPTSSPPIKGRRTGRGSTLRILTEHGARTRRASIATRSSQVPMAKVRASLADSGLTVRGGTSDDLVRRIYTDAVEAGMISDK